MTFIDADQTLMAYADGELDAAARSAVERALAADPEIAAIVTRHRALRVRLQDTYRQVLDEPIPQRLGDLLAQPVTGPVTANRPPAARTPAIPGSRLRRLPRWSALAASAVLGLSLGLVVPRNSDAPYMEATGGLVARGDLARALTEQIAGATTTGTARVGFSFRDHSGTYCRTFRIQQGAALAGYACRDAAEWRLQILAAATPDSGELRTAAAMPIAVLQAVDAAIADAPLDAAAEAKARDAGWHGSAK